MDDNFDKVIPYGEPVDILSLLEWYNKHKNHKRLHKIGTTGEITLTGEVYYILLLCMDCKRIYILDKFEVEKEIDN